MNAYVLLVTEALISIAVSLAVLYVLSDPLVSLLRQICPGEHAALFWLQYTRMMLMIAPLLLVLTVDMFTHFSDPKDSLRLALIATLSGLLIGLHVIGQRVGRFVTLPEQKEEAS